MIATAELESAIRSAIPVLHLEIIDQSSGCGENYAILVVSEVRVVIIGPSNRIQSNMRLRRRSKARPL
jgi:hypothetical protein